MYICMYIYICMCLYIHMCVYIYVYMYMFILRQDNIKWENYAACSVFAHFFNGISYSPGVEGRKNTKEAT